MRSALFRGMLLGLLAAAGLGCKPNSRVTDNSIFIPKKQPAAAILAKAQAQRIVYQSLSAKAKAYFEDSQNSVSFTVNLRAQRDSLIWLTAKKASVEGARMRVSPQKVEILDRQSDVYMAQPFSYIEQQFRIPLQFKELQGLLVGDWVLPADLEFKSSVEGSRYKLVGANPQLEMSLWVDGETYQLQRMRLEADNRWITAEITQYMRLGEEGDSTAPQVPQTIDMVLFSPESGEARLQLHYNKLELDVPVEMPFEIPDHYERRP